jgi:D-alanine---(R)-lactate ligase
MDRLKAGIIFGGYSEEHPVSVKSARGVAKNLDAGKYEPFWAGITKSGARKLCDGPDADRENGDWRPAVLSPDQGARGLLVLERGKYETISLDVVLPVPHGRLGEDGARPARSGSSFGVSKVSGEEELPNAVKTARQYDTKSHGFFRIHQESEPESGSENSTFIVPADIPAELRPLVQEMAKAVYRALGCRGLSRVDMFLKEDGTAVLNEVNTLPGMTSYSRYPRMTAAAGLPLAEMVDRMVSLALTGKAGER